MNTTKKKIHKNASSTNSNSNNSNTSHITNTINSNTLINSYKYNSNIINILTKKDIVSIEKYYDVYKKYKKQNGGTPINVNTATAVKPDDDKDIYGVTFTHAETLSGPPKEYSFFIKIDNMSQSAYQRALPKITNLSVNNSFDIYSLDITQNVYEANFYHNFNRINNQFSKTIDIINIYGNGIVTTENTNVTFVIDNIYFEFDIRVLDINIITTKVYAHMVLEWNKDLILLNEYLETYKTFSKQQRILAVAQNSIINAYNKFNFLHCDLHKGNLLVHPVQNKVYLYDFGMSELGGTTYRNTYIPKYTSSIHTSSYRIEYIFRLLSVPQSWYRMLDYNTVNSNEVIQIHKEPLWKNLWHALDIYRLIMENSVNDYKYYKWKWNDIKNILIIKPTDDIDPMLLNYIKLKNSSEANANTNNNAKANAKANTNEYNNIIECMHNEFNKNYFLKLMIYGIIYSIEQNIDNSVFNNIKNDTATTVFARSIRKFSNNRANNSNSNCKMTPYDNISNTSNLNINSKANAKNTVQNTPTHKANTSGAKYTTP